MASVENTGNAEEADHPMMVIEGYEVFCEDGKNAESGAPAVVQQVTSPAVQQVTSPAVQQVTSPAVQQVTSPAVQQVTSPAVQQVTSPAVTTVPTVLAQPAAVSNLNGGLKISNVCSYAPEKSVQMPGPILQNSQNSLALLNGIPTSLANIPGTVPFKPGTVTILSIPQKQIPSSTGAPTFIQLPAQQIHNVVQQVAGPQGLPAGQTKIYIQQSAGGTLAGSNAQIFGPQTNALAGGTPIRYITTLPGSVQDLNNIQGLVASANLSQQPTTVGSLIEQLVKKNEDVLLQSDATALKPSQRNYGKQGDVLTGANSYFVPDKAEGMQTIRVFPKTSLPVKVSSGQTTHHTGLNSIQTPPITTAPILKPGTFQSLSARSALQSEYPAVTKQLQQQPATTTGPKPATPPSPANQPGSCFSKVSVKENLKVALLKRKLKEAQKINISSKILRPKSPTRMCSIIPEDEDMFSLSLVQLNVKNKNPGVFDIDSNQIICGISTKALMRTGTNIAVSLDSDYYWCNFCPFKTAMKKVFLNHVMMHRFNCKYCRYQSYSRADVIHHSFQEHRDFDGSASSLHYCALLNDHLKVVNGLGPHKSARTSGLSESAQKYQPTGKPTISQGIPDVDKGSMTLLLQGQELSVSNKEFEYLDMEVEEVGHVPVFNDMEAEAVADGLNAAAVEDLAKPAKAQTSVNGGRNKQVPAMETTTPGNLSTLSWNCYYCDFVSQNYELIKVHCTIMHPELTMKAKRLMVSDELAIQIRKLDSVRQLHLDKGQKEFLQSTESRSSVSSTGLNATARKEPEKIPVTQKVSKDKPEDMESPETEQFLRTVQSYECYNCHGQTLKMKELNNHLAREHAGGLFVAIDLRAVRLKQARHIVFCAIPGCDFSTKNTEDYLEHYNTCFPNWETSEQLDGDIRKSILDTLAFAEKSLRVVSRGRFKTQTFKCRYCEMKSCFVTRVKKHVAKLHKGKTTMYTHCKKNTSGGKQNLLMYFCPRCYTYDTGKRTRLAAHMRNVHGLTGSDTTKQVDSPESDQMTEELEDGTVAVIHPVEGVEEENVNVVDDEDVKPDPEELEVMMDDYIEQEAQESEMISVGRATRHAAVKAHVKLKARSHVPRLYKCRVCKHQCLGIKLIRGHIQKMHPSSPLVAIDVKKREQRQSAMVFLCPSQGCGFFHKEKNEVLKHGAEVHQIPIDEMDAEVVSPLLSPELDEFSSPSPSKASPDNPVEKTPQVYQSEKYPPGFQCLYCTVSFTTETSDKMREHIHKLHPGDDMVMRDMVASKLHRPSRIYHCDRSDCDFMTVDKKGYIEHSLAHREGCLYECGYCCWFTREREHVEKHMEIHEGKGLLYNEIALKFDSSAHIIKTRSIKVA